MRHKKHNHTLGVTEPHRKAMLANLCSSLIEHGRIKTTLAKAKALRPFAEKVVTLAKKANVAEKTEDKLHFRRLAISKIRNKIAVRKLFDERVTEFVDRQGGYTRIYKIGQRRGDAAEVALIEFVSGSDEGYTKSKKRAKTAASSDVVDTVVEEVPSAPEVTAESK
jgi:large subunit ribosomal protein L17